MVTIEKRIDRTKSVVPLMAALPYAVSADEESGPEEFQYDPTTQRTIFASNRDYSTSRSDDSAGGFLKTKSDTKKDD